MDNSINSQNIHSWHPGDPDIEDMERWRHSDEGQRILAALDAARPKFLAEYHGRPIIYGTAGNIERGNLEELFYNPQYCIGVDPYSPETELISRFFMYKKIDNVWGLLP